MIDQTVPLRELTAGMAQTLREWILPHLRDPMAKTQAETLATLIEGLPAAVSADACRSIVADNDAARALLKKLGESPTDGAAEDTEAAMRENAVLKARLVEIAEAMRGDASKTDQLGELQAFFLASMKRELEMVKRGADFAAMTSQEDAARES